MLYPTQPAEHSPSSIRIYNTTGGLVQQTNENTVYSNQDEVNHSKEEPRLSFGKIKLPKNDLRKFCEEQIKTEGKKKKDMSKKDKGRYYNQFAFKTNDLTKQSYVFDRQTYNQTTQSITNSRNEVKDSRGKSPNKYFSSIDYTLLGMNQPPSFNANKAYAPVVNKQQHPISLRTANGSSPKRTISQNKLK